MRAPVLELVRGALAAIDAARARVDDLNVYPVPDGDTGTNLASTTRAVVEAIDAATTDDRAELARIATRAALLGARGNSGVIFSQVVAGAASSLAVSDDLAAAFRSAADAAYAAVPSPVEGTMLTAIRELAEEAEAGGDLAAIVARGDDCVVRTREMLPVLTQAGVVDAGAAGLVEIVRGIAAAAAGEPLPAVSASLAVSAASIHREVSEYRFCTTFVVEGEELDLRSLEAELEALGDSLLVVGGATALKVHVHTNDPDTALALGAAIGVVSGVEIADMVEQARERERRLSGCSVVAVVAGAGNAELFRSLGAYIVDGGATLNPSTAELLAALEEAGGDEAIVLPNSANVVLAAERAAAEASRPTTVLRTESLQAGLAALVAYSPESPAAANLAEMGERIAAVSIGSVARSGRVAQVAGAEIAAGSWLGIADGAIVAGGDDFDQTAKVVIEQTLVGGRSLLTLLTGEGCPPVDGLLARIAADNAAVEVELHDGSQPLHALLVSAE